MRDIVAFLNSVAGFAMSAIGGGLLSFSFSYPTSCQALLECTNLWGGTTFTMSEGESTVSSIVIGLVIAGIASGLAHLADVDNEGGILE